MMIPSKHHQEFSLLCSALLHYLVQATIISHLLFGHFLPTVHGPPRFCVLQSVLLTSARVTFLPYTFDHAPSSFPLNLLGDPHHSKDHKVVVSTPHHGTWSPHSLELAPFTRGICHHDATSYLLTSLYSGHTDQNRYKVTYIWKVFLKNKQTYSSSMSTHKAIFP